MNTLILRLLILNTVATIQCLHVKTIIFAVAILSFSAVLRISRALIFSYVNSRVALTFLGLSTLIVPNFTSKYDNPLSVGHARRILSTPAVFDLKTYAAHSPSTLQALQI